MDLHHPLLIEFPELREHIIRLTATDQNFRTKLRDYDKIDDEIAQMEEERIHASDCELETLKIRRVHLKDELLHAARALAHPQMAH